MNRQSGLSLIELMIALTLGLVVTAAASSIFLGTRGTYSTSTGVSVMTENARFATEFLTRSLRSTGFIGCNEAPRVDTTILTPASVLFDFGNVLSGYEAASPTWAPVLPGALTGMLTPSGTPVAPVSGSDVLVVHGTAQQSIASPKSVTTIANGSDQFSVADATGLATGELAVISDCAKATAFQITKLTGTTLFHDAQLSNGSSVFALNYATGAFIYLPTTQVYFIGTGADGDSALFRAELNETAGVFTLVANELVPDIENMQVLYGVDPSGLQNASSYVTADQVPAQCPLGNFNCVVSVEVALLVASPPNTVPALAAAQASPSVLGTTINIAAGDSRLRTVAQVTVALRNGLP